jgi:hypothetical protein
VAALADQRANARRSLIPPHTISASVIAWRQNVDYGWGWLGWAGAGSPGTETERPSRIPRFISSLSAGLSAGAVSRQLQARVPNGFGSVPIEFGLALAGAAPATKQPRAIAALTSIFVITWWC